VLAVTLRRKEATIEAECSSATSAEATREDDDGAAAAVADGWRRGGGAGVATPSGTSAADGMVGQRMYRSVGDVGESGEEEEYEMES
jgi:hypothetical protein